MRCLRIVVVVCVACFPALAWAQDDMTERDYEIADATAMEATKAYVAKEYAQSINLYKTAYEYAPYAIYLASAARVATDAGALTQAKSLAENALAITDEAWALEEDDAQRLGDLIVEIDAKMAAELAKTGEWSWVGYTGAGVATLGVGAMVGTLVIAAGVDARRDELAASTRKSEYDALFAELSERQALGQTLLYSGAALALVGGGLVAWDLLTPGGVPYEAPTLSLDLGRDRAHVQVGWRW